MSGSRGSEPGGVGVRAFLIADVRGYTAFSNERGDEAASSLAREFAAVVREVVEVHDGVLLEVRGDEALCVFGSAREALKAAVDLQRRLRTADAIPLGVGIGLDAGEAVPTDGGYRGRALNVAARLCGLARAGQILASETIATLAGPHDGLSFAPRRPVRLKGLDAPVRYVEVVPEEPLPPVAAPPTRPRRRRRRRIVVLGIAAVILAAASVAAALLTTGGSDEPPLTVVSNSVAVIDPATNLVVDDIPVGASPTAITVAGGQVWVLNRDDRTISLINATTRGVRTVSVPGVPADLAVGFGKLWVGEAHVPGVVPVDLETTVPEPVIKAQPLGPPPPTVPEDDAGAVAIGLDAVWFLSGNSTVSRIDPESQRVVRRRHAGTGGTAFIAWGEGAAWVSACCEDPTRVAQDGTTSTVPIPATGPVAVGGGTVFMLDGAPGNSLYAFDTVANEPIGLAAVGPGALDVAVGAGTVWVANGSAGTVSGVDPASLKVTKTIRVGGTPSGIAVGAGYVWVAVS
jgi:YVTN family beta-propeller protein